MDDEQKSGPREPVDESDWIGLWEDCLTGTPAATDAFVKEVHPRIECVYRWRVSDPEDVKELTQDFFLKLFEDKQRRLRTYDPSRGTPLLAFLCVIAVRLLIDRRRGREFVHRSDRVSWEAVYEFVGQEPRAERDLLIRELGDALKFLSETEQVAVRLRLECLTSAEIGKPLSMPAASVDRLLWRARQKLKEILESGPTCPQSGG